MESDYSHVKYPLSPIRSSNPRPPFFLQLNGGRLNRLCVSARLFVQTDSAPHPQRRHLRTGSEHRHRVSIQI